MATGYYIHTSVTVRYTVLALDMDEDTRPPLHCWGVGGMVRYIFTG